MRSRWPDSETNEKVGSEATVSKKKFLKTQKKFGTLGISEFRIISYVERK